MDRAVEPADGTVLSFPGDMSGCEELSADADLPRAVLLSGTGPEMMLARSVDTFVERRRGPSTQTRQGVPTSNR